MEPFKLKMWKCGNEQSGKTFAEASFTGHQNEKNFVGLATDGDYIACGSEDNSLYVYYKGNDMMNIIILPKLSYRRRPYPQILFSGLERPLIKYRFEVQRTILPEHLSGSRPDEDSSEFLSAVAWRPRTNTLLAANSQGIIKLLTLK